MNLIREDLPGVHFTFPVKLSLLYLCGVPCGEEILFFISALPAGTLFLVESGEGGESVYGEGTYRRARFRRAV